MRLDSIDSHKLAAKSDARRWWIVALLFGTLTLAGCAEGTRRDAERGQQQDAERTSVVSDLQATRSADLIMSTPPATPPPADE